MPSDHGLIPGQPARFGASQRRRMVAALCVAGNGRVVALTAKDLRNETFEDGRVLDGWELLDAVEIGTSPPADIKLEAADLARHWDDNVYRAQSGARRVPGILTGLRGLMQVRTHPGHIHVRSLLEIQFDARAPDGNRHPVLAAEDLGSLISTAAGLPCAILVAGAGQIGYAVLLHPTLAQLGLVLLELPEIEYRLDAGLAPIAAELMHSTELGLEALKHEVIRETELDLGERPLLKAA